MNSNEEPQTEQEHDRDFLTWLENKHAKYKKKESSLPVQDSKREHYRDMAWAARYTQTMYKSFLSGDE